MKERIGHYISLIGILVASLIGICYFQYDKVFQIGIAFALVGAYVSWGIIHHLIHKDLYLQVVLEYIAVSLLGLVLIVSLLLRG